MADKLGARYPIVSSERPNLPTRSRDNSNTTCCKRNDHDRGHSVGASIALSNIDEDLDEGIPGVGASDRAHVTPGEDDCDH